MSVGGLISPLIGALADRTSLRTALTPLVLMPVLAWLLFRTLPEPALPAPSGVTESDGDAPSRTS